jgi:hypothetical protein
MADVNGTHRIGVSIRSRCVRNGFKAEHKVGESLTRDRFIFCSGAMTGNFHAVVSAGMDFPPRD